MEVASSLLPYFIGYRVHPIAEPGHHFAECERSAFGLREIGRVAPGSHGSDPLIAGTCLPKLSGVSVHADPASVDLAGAQAHQLKRLQRNAAALNGLQESLHGQPRLGHDHHGIANPCLDRIAHVSRHAHSFSMSICIASSVVCIVNEMSNAYTNLGELLPDAPTRSAR